MKQLKLAFITTITADAVLLISAIESVNEKFGEVAKVQLVADMLQVSDIPMDDFIQFAQQSHIAIIHLMGDLSEFDRLVSSLKSAGVPIFVAASFFGQNKKYRDLSTVDPEDCQKIFMHINYSAKRNFENLLLYLANRFTGANYEMGTYERQNWEGIYHPDFERIPSQNETVT